MVVVLPLWMWKMRSYTEVWEQAPKSQQDTNLVNSTLEISFKKEKTLFIYFFILTVTNMQSSVVK